MKLKYAWMCAILSGVVVIAQANGQNNTFPASGNVGIGTTTPTASLHVLQSGSPVIEVQSSDAGFPGVIWKNSSAFYATQIDGGNGSLYWWNGGASRSMTLQQNGYLGLGTPAPLNPLEVIGDYNGQNDGWAADAGQGQFTIHGGTNTLLAFGIGVDTTSSIVRLQGQMIGSGTLPIVMNPMGGNVGIGTPAPGAKLEVNGSIKLSAGAGASMTYSDNTVQSTAWTGVLSGGDYAESVDVTGERASFEPGDLLVIDPKQHGRFEKSNGPYSALVSGVYATKPGVTGRRQPRSKPQDNEVPMAMVGIVPTKVSTENGPIRDGDLLVSSSTPGYAMRGTNRKKIMGAVIGKALGSLDTGMGMIEVLVYLQ